MKTPRLFEAMGRFVETFGGRYITAEDVGVGIEDLRHVRKHTRWVTGLAREDGGSGNPSPYTALGCFEGIKVAAAEVWGSEDLDGRVVALQGPGSVGFALGRQLRELGARLVVSDVSKASVDRAVRELGARAVDTDAIYDVPCDIFAPCALGGVLDDSTIPRLRCRVVAGAANNQLLDETRHAQMLKERGMLYAPDYVINAGGLINIAQELQPDGYDRERALARVAAIGTTLEEVFERAAQADLPTHEVADRIARERIAAGGRRQARPMLSAVPRHAVAAG
jgi:leucine dehydrogenase